MCCGKNLDSFVCLFSCHWAKGVKHAVIFFEKGTCFPPTVAWLPQAQRGEMSCPIYICICLVNIGMTLNEYVTVKSQSKTKTSKVLEENLIQNHTFLSEASLDNVSNTWFKQERDDKKWGETEEGWQREKNSWLYLKCMVRTLEASRKHWNLFKNAALPFTATQHFNVQEKIKSLFAPAKGQSNSGLNMKKQHCWFVVMWLLGKNKNEIMHHKVMVISADMKTVLWWVLLYFLIFKGEVCFFAH